MNKEGYITFCPIAKACEILEPRWTLLVLCEMWHGSTRFNDIRRGVPAMSPTLLSKRLKELELHGLVKRTHDSAAGEIHYTLTETAMELEPIAMELANWAHRNIDTDVKLERLDARVLMWNMRRKVNISALPRGRRCVIQFIYPELPEVERHYWIVARPGLPIDLCTVDPGQEVDLYITADLRATTSAWMGYSTLAAEVAREKISLVGDQRLIHSMGEWMVRSRYASVPRKCDVAA